MSISARSVQVDPHVAAIPWRRLALLDAFLLAALVRLANLGRWSLWYDETVSVYLAQQPLRAMLAHTAGDIHPPAYYALLHLWQTVTAPTPVHGLEYLFGFASVAAGLLALALLYAVGRATVGQDAALVALWLGALNPFQIWFSQEVRMYSVAAALALLCLWATLRWFQQAKLRWLVVFAVTSATGLYTLYYFFFVLAGLAAASLLLARSGRRWFAWAGANLAALGLFAPWLPIFIRQATEPPVPPWRAAWQSLVDALASLNEALAALLVGQTGLGPLGWWALVVVGVVLAFLAFVRAPARAKGALVAFVFVPFALLFLLTALAMPLYHVRYLFAFAAPFLLMAGAVVVAAWRRAAWAGLLIGLVLVGGSVASVGNLWTNPAFARDDHRGAVATLMREWRPGDVLLVNAGWAYTPLSIYWDAGLSTQWAAPLLDTPRRLLPDEVRTLPLSGVLVPVVRTGSVDGEATLGWGAPEADFFAASTAQTLAALEELRAQGVLRIWHYRIYDTVSDPGGVIRAWLDANTRTLRDDAIPGRDFGRIELRAFTPELPLAQAEGTDTITFGGAVTLQLADVVRTWLDTTPLPPQGASLYANLLLGRAEGAASGDAVPPLAASLRVYSAANEMVAQHDQPLAMPVDEWRATDRVRAALGVTLPASTPAGPYTLQLILYDAVTGEALPIAGATQTVDGQRLVLAEFAVAQAE